MKDINLLFCHSHLCELSCKPYIIYLGVVRSEIRWKMESEVVHWGESDHLKKISEEVCNFPFQPWFCIGHCHQCPWQARTLGLLLLQRHQRSYSPCSWTISPNSGKHVKVCDHRDVPPYLGGCHLHLQSLSAPWVWRPHWMECLSGVLHQHRFQQIPFCQDVAPRVWTPGDQNSPPSVTRSIGSRFLMGISTVSLRQVRRDMSIFWKREYATPDSSPWSPAYEGQHEWLIQPDKVKASQMTGLSTQ